MRRQLANWMDLQLIFKKITEPIRAEYQKWYHKKPRIYSYKELEVHVLPGVFSPISNNSTLALLNYTNTLDLKHKTVLELGCGTGILSLLADEKGALVTASDINETALNELSIKNREENRGIITVYSDLLENLHFHFDYMLINPPYQPKKPQNIEDVATWCGLDFDYFNCLFSQLHVRSISTTTVIMVLPEEAELFAISRRAAKYHLKLKTLKVSIIKGERVVVYEVVEGE